MKPAFLFAVCQVGSEPARVWGTSLGTAAGVEEVVRIVDAAFPREQRLRLHVWERDRARPGEEPPDFGALAPRAKDALRAALSRRVQHRDAFPLAWRSPARPSTFRPRHLLGRIASSRRPSPGPLRP